MNKLIILAANGVHVPILCWIISLLPLALVIIGAIISLFKPK